LIYLAQHTQGYMSDNQSISYKYRKEKTINKKLLSGYGKRLF